jgi:hypothetical protein
MTETDATISKFSRIPMPDFLLFCVILAVMPELNCKYEHIFAVLHNDKTAWRPTLALAADLYSQVERVEDGDIFAAVIHPAFELLFRPLDAKSERSVLNKSLILNAPAMFAVSGAKYCPERCELLSSEEETPPIIARLAEYEQILSLLKADGEGKPFLLRLYGERGSGKRFVLRKAAATLGKSLLVADCGALLRDRAEPAEIRELAAACLLSDAFLCFDGFEATAENTAALKEVLKTVGKYLSAAAVTGTGDKVFEPPAGCVCRTVEFGAAGPDGQRRLWDYFIESGGHKRAADVSVDDFVKSYDLTAGVIADVVRSAQMSGELTKRGLENAVRENTRTSLANLAVPVRMCFTWDDLILDDEALRMLKKVCARVRYGRAVNDEWGLGSKMPYGRGVSLLMYGAPGTGKTMAAQVLANELGRDLYKIDISKLVSKYIGETEKNLGAVFDAARGGSGILFFDEADSLLTKRTEIKDAHDKHANAETSYLLQRLEEHDGVSILATNNAANIDAAFKRRINYFINIEKPEAPARLRIWESLITENLPLSRDVNLETFARKYGLTGSEIKSVLTEAAYAAAESGGEITRDGLLSAIGDEYKKDGRLLSKADLI